MRRRAGWVGLLAVLALPASATALSASATALSASSNAQPGSSTPLCTATHWVASWGNSPSDAGVGLDASLQEVALGADQTLRMIITPHLAGRVVRLHLSNRFGTRPVTFSDVAVADRASGASLVPGSDRAVTFNGGDSAVTVPAGADVVSDPVEFVVTPFTDVAVSMYLAGSDLQPTEHFTGRQTSYLTVPADGDHVSDMAAAAFSQSTTARFYVTGLDVDATDRVGTVVTFGDSITDGFQGPSTHYPEVQATLNLNDRYPDFLQRRLDAAGIPVSVDNAGISGNRLLSNGFVPPFGVSGLSRFSADALDIPGVTDVILLEGINDIGLTQGITAEQLISGYEQAITTAHAAGLKIQLGTLTPAGGYTQAGYSDAAGAALRVAVNTWIRGQHLSDGIVDFDAAVRDPSDPGEIAPQYNGGDGLHMDPAGYQAMANAVPLSELARASCRVPARRKTKKKHTSTTKTASSTARKMTRP